MPSIPIPDSTPTPTSTPDPAPGHDSSPARTRTRSASPFEARIGFCRAVRDGDIIAVSGTAPIGPDGRTAGVGDPAEQTRRCFRIVQEALESLGGSLEDVIRTRVYITRLEDWEAIGSAHGEIFSDIRPASTILQVQGLLDPEWRVEVEADAVVRRGGTSGNSLTEGASPS